MESPSRGGSLRIPRLSRSSLKSRLLEHVPELGRLARCQVEVLFNRDSAHIGPDEWAAIARAIEKRWDDYDGVVVLHGTDSLAYTASALSFLLRPCRKPVVVTGAMRPLSALRSDARQNLISAVEIAAHGPRPLVSQVTAFFDDRLFQGNRVRKRSASDYGAFESPKAPPLAVVGTSISYRGGEGGASRPDRASRRRAGEGRKAPRLEPRFSRRVPVLRVTPGFPAREVAEGLIPAVDGLVLIVFPSVTGPTHDPAFMEMLAAARRRAVPVVIVTDGVSSAPGMSSHPRSYAAGADLLKAGCLWAGDLTPECAFVKASLILGQKSGQERFKQLWRTDLAGEGCLSN